MIGLIRAEHLDKWASRITSAPEFPRLVRLLVHFTAPTVHPGWDGPLALEMINLGPVPFVLKLGMPIAQLIVEEVKGIPAKHASQFQGQTSPGGATT